VNPLLRRSAAHVFVPTLDAPTLSDGDEHHLRRVLRVGPRDALTVSDGAGRWAPGLLGADGIELTGGVVVEPRPAPRCVACAVPKGDRPEWIVQKLTELGIDRIMLFEAARSVVRWDGAKVDRNLERLQRIAFDAAMQSRRVWLPTVERATWSDVIGLAGVALADPDAASPVDAAVQAIAIGPEGGFSPEELAVGVPTVSLGAQVLRVETAALVAAVLLDRSRAAVTPGGT
jgi:16S rRNA (uracil1498-N3)-methyltransferase